MIESIVDFDPYKVPSNKIRQNRKVFYGLKKNRGERIKTWFNRVRSRVDCCAFAKLTEILLIDKFLCELGKEEIRSFQNTETWSLKQLNEYFSGRNADTGKKSHSKNNDNDVDQCQEFAPLETVKYEIVSIVKI